MSEESRSRTIQDAQDKFNGRYIQLINNELLIDENLLNLDIVNFKISTGIYSSRIAYIQELKKNGLNTGYMNYDYYKPSDKLKENVMAKVSFKDVFIEYATLRDKKASN